MALLDDLYSKKNSYINLRDKINDVLGSLNSGISSLEQPSSNIGVFYAINGQSADLNIIRNKKNELLNKRDYITQNVIPAINDKISNIEADIRNEEERIRREEQERREREAREQREREAQEQREREAQKQRQRQTSATSRRNTNRRK